jgi:circadian clock protein KaiB
VNPRQSFRFRLFTADDTLNSTQALLNLTAFCEAHFPGRYDIEIVDVLREPKRALLEGIFMTPTLVRLAPKPIRRIVGTLSDPSMLLRAMGLAAAA